MIHVLQRISPYYLFPLVLMLSTLIAQNCTDNIVVVLSLYSTVGILLASISQRLNTSSAIAKELNSQDEVLKALGLKSASLVHNIRNYMTILQGTASLISREFGEKASIKQALEIQSSCLEQAKAMLDDLMSAIRMEGKSTKTSRPITAVLEEALQLAEVLIEKTETQVFREFDTEIANLNYNDIGLMQSVVNIIKNSAEACANNGKIIVATKISQRNLRKVFQIIFKDNGKGLDTQTMNNLFRPFVSNKRGGIGIGLYTVKNLVERDGGSVEVKSSAEQGTEIVLNFPC